MLIPGYPKGSNITIINTMYNRPTRDNDGKKVPDNLTIIFRDNDTGEKHHHTILNPDYEFYMAKNNVYIEKDVHLLQIEKDKVDKFTVPYANLEKEIATSTGQLDEFYNNIKNGNRYENRRVHLDPTVFFSDVDIQDHYRFRFNCEYKNESFTLSKSYFDIEVDTINMKADFPEMGECPINAASLLDEKTNKVYTFILRDENNPLIQEFENSIDQDLFSELRAFITEAVGGWKQATRFGIVDIGQEFLFFDSELDLIKTIFKYMRKLNSDFLLVWNAAFDIPYIIERIKALGVDPNTIMTDTDFEVRVARYYVDERNKNDLAERGDFANISMMPTVIDQMIQLASRRKGRGAIPNFKLDTIGQVFAKVKKLDYSHITTKIAKLPWLDFKTFIFYNIMDVIVQKCIESKTSDTEYIFNKCLINNTRLQKGHRQTVYLINKIAKEFYEKGFIIGNNANKFGEKPTVKFPGALVGDPLKTNDYAKLFINGRVSFIANNLVDYDYKSLYPSITLENNMAPHTQVGKIIIPEKVYMNENVYGNENYSRGGEYCENLVSGNIIEFSKRWLHLGGYKDVVEDMKEFYSTGNNYSSRPVDYFDVNGKIQPFYYSSIAGVKQNAVNFVEDYHKPRAISFYNNCPQDLKDKCNNELRRTVYVE